MSGRDSPKPSTSTGTSRRRREEDSGDEQPLEKISKRYTPPTRSPVDTESRQKARDSSSSSTASKISEKDRKDRSTISKRPDDRKKAEQQTKSTRNERIYEIVQTRPETCTVKKGTSGKIIRLEANYFKLLTRPEWSIYQYRVDFEPEIELVRLKRGILSEQKGLFGGYLFDGSLLYITKRLPEDKMEFVVKSKTEEEYKITIKFVGVVGMRQWQSLQILNLILRRAMEGLKLQLIGRNFFDPNAKINIPQYRIQLWPGYITSIRQHENDILVCAEIAHKVMRTETVYDIMRHCISDGSRKGGDWTEDFRRQVIGLTVLTDYNNKTYRIDDVDMSFKASMTFNMKGKEISFADYYYQKYKIRIRDPNQPLLASRNKDNKFKKGKGEEMDKVFLIPELCRVTGIDESMRANQQLMKAMADHTRTNPDKRIDILKKFNRRLQDVESSRQLLTDWNMKLDRNLVQIQARTLDPESICFKDKKVPLDNRADWGNYFRDTGMFTVAYLDRWVIVAPARFRHDTRDFVSKLIKVASGMHMRIEHPRDISIHDDRNQSYLQAIDRAANEDPKLIIFLVPNKNSERYTTIKKKCCVERAIPTQVVVQSNIGSHKRNAMSIITKIAIQINAKLGGAPWMVSLPMKGLMVIGYDTCKSTKDKTKGYAALVATMDQKIKARYFSTVSQTYAFDLLSNEIHISVGKALHEYRRSHESLPEKIILYRDGVGSGALKQVFEHEVKNLVDFLEKMYAKANLPPPRFSFIIVSKRINARFFAGANNPIPGTVIDDVVTLPESYDFYLVSQSVRQGAVSPTLYNVLYDTSKLNADKLQILTYKMCHLYYNWSGTTRVPAVCQYASKLANLVGQHLHNLPSNTLEKQLYYL